MYTRYFIRFRASIGRAAWKSIKETCFHDIDTLVKMCEERWKQLFKEFVANLANVEETDETFSSFSESPPPSPSQPLQELAPESSPPPQPPLLAPPVCSPSERENSVEPSTSSSSTQPPPVSSGYVMFYNPEEELYYDIPITKIKSNKMNMLIIDAEKLSKNVNVVRCRISTR